MSLPAGCFVNVCDVNLDRGVIFGGDDAVARRAESDKCNNETGWQLKIVLGLTLVFCLVLN